MDIGRLKRYKGFTLIELIVAIGILGVMATFGLIALNPIAQVQKAHDARRKADLAEIQHALELFYQDCGHYPANVPPVPGADYFRFATQCSGGPAITFGQAWPPYMSHVPNDPKGWQGGAVPLDLDWHYQYAQLDGGQGYCIYASLERKSSDPQICPANGATGNQCPKINTPVIPCSIGGQLSNGTCRNPHCGPVDQDPTQNCNYGICSTNETP